MIHLSLILSTLALFTPAILANQDFDFGDFAKMFNEETLGKDGEGLESLLKGINGGKATFCKSNEVVVPKLIDQYDEPISVNGCGPGAMNIPDEFGLVKCCNEHDLCYQVCGMSFRACEKTFKKCNINICNDFEEEEKQECLKIAESYSAMTSLFGSTMYKKSQQAVCSCIPEDDTESVSLAHKNFLIDFYKRYNEEKNEGDVDRVLERYSKSMGKAYLKLAKRYTQYIRFDNVEQEL